MSFLKNLIKNNDKTNYNKEKETEIDNSFNEKNIKDNEHRETFPKINNYFKIDEKNKFLEIEYKNALSKEIYTKKFKDNEELINDNVTRIKNKLF